ncbi:MAG: hypothetical protein ACI8RO_001400, partial [Flavobacteriales bacterium]
LFCLYFRVDNTRHTKIKYNKVIDNVIDWQWLFAQHINPDKITKGIIKVKIPFEKLANSVVIPSNPVQKLRADIFEDDSTQAKHSLDISIDSPAEDAEDDLVVNTNAQNNKAEVSNNDTKLVFAIEKLVMMKKQGYLNEHEFTIAKTKILKNLANN